MPDTICTLQYKPRTTTKVDDDRDETHVSREEMTVWPEVTQQ